MLSTSDVQFKITAHVLMYHFFLLIHIQMLTTCLCNVMVQGWATIARLQNDSEIISFIFSSYTKKKLPKNEMTFKNYVASSYCSLTNTKITSYLLFRLFR